MGNAYFDKCLFPHGRALLPGLLVCKRHLVCLELGADRRLSVPFTPLVCTRELTDPVDHLVLGPPAERNAARPVVLEVGNGKLRET